MTPERIKELRYLCVIDDKEIATIVNELLDEVENSQLSIDILLARVEELENSNNISISSNKIELFGV